MVDREARRQYGELLRQFISGRMTNDKYEERSSAIKCDANDPAVIETYYQAWFLYDDIKTHRMTGTHRLNREGRRTIARAVLFLQSDQEYGWPKDSGFGILMTLFLVADVAVGLLLLALFPDKFMLTLGAFACLGALAVAYSSIRMILEKRLWAATGDVDAWPFLRHSDLEEATRHPHLLNRQQSAQH